MIWERSGEAYFSTAEDAFGRPLWHLVVEPILSGGWDWTIWRPRGNGAAARTVQEAMQAAEQAAC